MCLSTFLPHLQALTLEAVSGDAHQITLHATARAPAAACPYCRQLSRRVHSHYGRIIADLPWSATPVTLAVQVRRFFCTNKDCACKIFCERLEEVAAAYGRRTQLLRTVLEAIGLALGGRAGAALGRQVRLVASRRTLLRLVCALPPPAVGPVRVLGIDDFAFKRGHRYGTLLCDQERRRPVDLLPERSADAVAAWLVAHPGVEIITRDRATVYKDGATRGAPAATQVVDRFHVLKNLGEALEEDFTALVSVLQEVAGLAAAAPPTAPAQESVPPEDSMLVPAEAVHLGRISATKQTRYAAVHALREQGLSQQAIAAQLGINRRTVRHDLAAAGGLRPRLGRCTYEPYLPYLLERWNAGGHNGTQLWREIRAQGYPGARSTLGPLFTQLRQLQGVPRRRRRPLPQRGPRLLVRPPVRVRDLVFAFLGQPDTLEPAQQHFLAHLCAHHQGLAATYRLTQDFVHLLHERQGTALEAWVAEVTTDGLPHLRAFAAGLRQDWPAVQAGLTLSWSNGPTEGHVNRIKMIKRMMFGRAGFTLLRQRVLHRRA